MINHNNIHTSNKTHFLLSSEKLDFNTNGTYIRMTENMKNKIYKIQNILVF